MFKKSKTSSRKVGGFLIVVCCLLFGMSFTVSTLIANGLSLTRKQHQQELERLGRKLFEVIERGDIEGLIALLGDKIVLGPDVVVAKRQLVRELRKRDGRAYAGLFDTERSRAYHREDLQRCVPPEGCKDISPPTSIQDHFRKARDVEIRVRFLVGETTDPPSLAVVGYDWPGRPSLNDLPNPAFMWTPKGWKLSDLFTVQAWGIAAPQYRPY